jgi:phage regulator Rha-like protein
MNELQAIPFALTMSSLEISRLVESRHDVVKTSMERLAEKGVITLPPLVEVSNVGMGPKTIEVYQVNKRDSYVVVAQLSPEFTARLVDRWQELEAAQTPKMPTLLEALEGWAKVLREKEATDRALMLSEADNALMRPKADLADSITKSDSEVTMTEAAKLFGIKLPAIKTFLVRNGWVSKDCKKTIAWAQKAGLVGFRMDYIPQLGREVPVVTIRGKGLGVLHESIRTGDLCASYIEKSLMLPESRA